MVRAPRCQMSSQSYRRRGFEHEAAGHNLQLAVDVQAGHDHPRPAPHGLAAPAAWSLPLGEWCLNECSQSGSEPVRQYCGMTDGGAPRSGTQWHLTEQE